MTKYQVKVHPVDENGNRAHVYWPTYPGMSPIIAELGRKGVGFSHYTYAIFTARDWALRDKDRYGQYLDP